MSRLRTCPQRASRMTGARSEFLTADETMRGAKDQACAHDSERIANLYRQNEVTCRYGTAD